VPEGDRLVRAGGWDGWEPNQLLGWDVHGKSLGVVGLGRIGSAVARRATGFGARVLYTRRSGPIPPRQVPPGARWEHRAELPALLAEADIVSLHVPYSTETRHLIGARELALMKTTAVLVNTSRGAVVDEQALVRALEAGPPAAAGLDVYEDEPRLHPRLAELRNTVLLPHLGSSTHETRARMAEVAAANLVAALGGETVPNPVNPEVLEDGRLPVR
jgi:glyoxylate reductase